MPGLLEARQHHVTPLSCLLGIVCPEAKDDTLAYKFRATIDRNAKLPVAARLLAKVVVGITQTLGGAFERGQESQG